MGHMTEHWIAAAPDPTTTTTLPPVAAPVGLFAATGGKSVAWVNDNLGDPSIPTTIAPDEIVGFVWSRSSRQDRYVQASRKEIMAALPGLAVPELVPEHVAFVTSQLVFDPATGRLGSEAVAAFGFWSDKPYTKSRSVSQLAVMMVALDELPLEPVVPDTIGVPESPADDERCRELVDGTVEECTEVMLEDGCPAWSLDLTEGWRLVWSRHGYTYDLFIRNADTVDVLAQMAGSCKELVPVKSVLAGAPEPIGAPVGNAGEPPAEAAGP
jgi:hypothetical protein